MHFHYRGQIHVLDQGHGWRDSLQTHWQFIYYILSHKTYYFTTPPPLKFVNDFSHCFRRKSTSFTFAFKGQHDLNSADLASSHLLPHSLTLSTLAGLTFLFLFFNVFNALSFFLPQDFCTCYSIFLGFHWLPLLYIFQVSV